MEVQYEKIIDPPRGWLYGFPKALPEAVTNIKEWLVTEGYPQSEIDSLGDAFYWRTILVKKEV